jgi:hypothetical protein
LDILKSTHLGKSGDNLSGRQSAFGTIQSGRTRYFLETHAQKRASMWMFNRNGLLN